MNTRRPFPSLRLLLALLALACLAQAAAAAPVAIINSPTDGQPLGDLTPVSGSANCLDFSYWLLSFKPSGGATWETICQGMSRVSNATLTTWDTSDLAEGGYDLRLQVFSTSGLEAEDGVTVDMTYVHCGDIDGDTDTADANYLYAFLHNGGPEPIPLLSGDLDCSGIVDDDDMARYVQWLLDPSTELCDCDSAKAAVGQTDGSPRTLQPLRTTLAQNYPNPFNPSTTIAYELSRQAAVDLRVYDVSGRLVSTLLAGEFQEAGRHTVEWLGRDDRNRPAPAGVYLYHLVAGKFSESRRMILLK